MDTILDYLDDIEEILENSRPSPFSSKVPVDRDKFFEIIEEIRLNLPVEMDKAQKIVSDHERIVADARNKAKMIISEAQMEAAKLADEHEVYRRALEQANETIEKSKKDAKDMRLNAMEYADEILAKAESTLREAMSSVNQSTRAIDTFFNNTLDIIYSNRQELRGNSKK